MSASAAAIGKIESEQHLTPQPWTTIIAGREYIDRTSCSNIEASACNEVIKTVLKILSSYPSLFKNEEREDALKEIFGKITALQSLPVTTEYRLFSRIIAHPFINVISSDERAVQFFSPAFVLQSKILNAEWGSDMEAGVPNAAYGELSSEKIKCIKDFMDDPSITLGSVEELLQHIAFFDYFEMEDLLTRSHQSLLKRIDSLPGLEQIQGVVTALNSFHVQNSTDLRATLEKRISDFCHEFITKLTSSEYDVFATKIAELENPITLDFSRSYITDSDLLLLLERFPTIIKGLDLSNCLALTSECVNTLSLFPNLTDLFLESNYFVTDEFVANLPTTLRVLSLNSNKVVTDASAEAWGKMTELKTLQLRSTNVGDKTVQHLPRGFVWLDLSVNRGVTDASAEYFEQMTELKTLRLTWTGVGDETVQHLPKGLVSLNLRDNREVTDASAEYFELMTELKELSLVSTSVGDKTVQHLPRGLKLLNLCGNRGVTDASAEALGKMRELKELLLSETGVGDKTVQHLPRGLVSLNLSINREVTDASAEYFEQMTELKELSLEDTSVGDKTVQHLPRGLMWLDLSGNLGVTDASAEYFEQMTELKTLLLTWTGVGDETVKRLPRGLVELKLNCNQGVTDASAEAWGKMTELKELQLRSTNVGDKIVQHLPRGLESLDLEGNWRVTDASAEAWGKMTELKELLLSGTGVGDKTVQHLPRGLELLDLCDNQGVTDASAKYFELMTELKELLLAGTWMSANEAKRLSEEAAARVR